MSDDNAFSHVFWVVRGSGDVFSRNLSSTRYSAVIPALSLGGNVVAYDTDTMSPKKFLDRYNPSRLILTKAFDQGFVELAQEAKKKNIPTMATAVDWHFDKNFNQKLFATVDKIVVQTQAMSVAVKENTGRTSIIIEEPYEGTRRRPRFKPKGPLRLLWYGGNNNLDGLVQCLGEFLSSQGNHYRLHVVAQTFDRAHEVLNDLPRHSGSTIDVDIEEWSMEGQTRALGQCDVVLIPSLMTKEKMVKGHNRLVEAIHAGRLAMAFPLPQYKELQNFCWCGEKLLDGISWALDNKLEAQVRIKKGQQYIDKRFSPEVVASRWSEEILSLLQT